MHALLPRWYTHSIEKTGRMRTVIREFHYGGLRGKKYVQRYVTVQFEVIKLCYCGLIPVPKGSEPASTEQIVGWMDATPEDFIHTETIVFERNKGDKE